MYILLVEGCLVGSISGKTFPLLLPLEPSIHHLWPVIRLNLLPLQLFLVHHKASSAVVHLAAVVQL